MELLLKLLRLPNNASIFRAELYAISLALAVIRRRKEKNFIIFSDSVSSLEAISGFKLEIDIVQNIIKDYTHLANSGKIIILCWIPSHVNIHGNERADTAAKSALSSPITNMKLPARGLRRAGRAAAADFLWRRRRRRKMLLLSSCLHLTAAVLYNALSSGALDSFQRFHRMAYAYSLTLL